MISDLMTIEYYFGRLEAVMTLEDLIRTYGPDKVKAALDHDELELRVTFCRIYARLTDTARRRPPVEDASIPAV